MIDGVHSVAILNKFEINEISSVGDKRINFEDSRADHGRTRIRLYY